MQPQLASIQPIMLEEEESTSTSSKIAHQTATSEKGESYTRSAGDGKPAESSSSSGNSSSCSSSSGVCRSAEQADGSMMKESPFTESSTPPPHIQWRESVDALLDSEDGVKLFRQYLEQEECDFYLNFWLACQGLKNDAKTNEPHWTEHMIRLICKKYLSDKCCVVCKDTRRRVKERLSKCPDIHVFDEAQKEVEAFMSRNLYENFLQSDLYLKFARDSDVPSPITQNVVLATVDENEELVGDCSRRIVCSVSKRKKGEETFVGSNAPLSYGRQLAYAKYAACVPASAQDSELHSLSSEADTMSLTDGSMDCYPVNSKKHERILRHYAKQNMDLNLYTPGFKPITDRVKPCEPKDINKFMQELIPKLEELKKKLDSGDQLEFKFQQMEEMDEKEDGTKSTHLFADFPPNVVKQLTAEEDHQSILDDHVSRVWDDSAHHSPTTAQVWPPRPPRTSHHKNKCRDRDFASNLSTDSGTVRDYVYGSSDSMPAGSGSYYKCHRPESRGEICRRKSGECALPATADQKVLVWMDNSCGSDSSTRHRKSSISSSVPNSQGGRIKKGQPVTYNVTRSGPLEFSGCGLKSWPVLPAHPLSQDPSMPRMDPPNTMTQLVEARRRLEDETKIKLSHSKSGLPAREKIHPDVQKARSNTLPARPNFQTDLTAGGDVGVFNKKLNRKSGPSTNSSTLSNEINEMTPILYQFQGERVPYLTKISGKNITLGQFKTLLSKKGKYRYFFRRACSEFEGGMVNEEITEDDAILPLWEGKVCAQVHAIE